MKYIVDTSIWIDFLHKSDSNLKRLLEESEVVIDSGTIMELASGHIKNRNEFLGFLRLLPRAVGASHDEILHMIETNKIYGIGLSATDLQVLASAKLSNLGIYTRDKAMLSAMKHLKIKRLEEK